MIGGRRFVGWKRKLYIRACKRSHSLMSLESNKSFKEEKGDMEKNPMSANSEVWINSINKENKAALEQWTNDLNIDLVQVNGQRIYGGPPPGWVGEVPPLGSEVFIGHLPQEIYEDKLIPLFMSVGKLYEFRLMMTFSGLNRGFAYARYPNNRLASLAIIKLNGYEIQYGYKILVIRSTEKCELAIEGLPAMLDEDTLNNAMRSVTAGVDTVSLYASPTSGSKNVAIIKYNSHRAASMAKKTLCEGTHLLQGCSFRVDWLKPNMKQKMESRELLPPHLSQVMALNREPKQQKKVLVNGVQCLKLICDHLKLGPLVYQIKFLSIGSGGWLRFWYHVTIPNSVPFTGFAWLPGANLIPTERYEHAREMVAMKILAELGYIRE